MVEYIRKADARSGELTLNKTAMALEKVAGVDIFEDKNKTQIKDMITILDELYAKWGTFTEKEQVGLAEAIAGKQQSKVFQSLMSNFEDVNAVREEFASGSHFGSAESENSEYLDSIAGKLNALKETWTSVLNTLADSEAIKGMLDVLIAVSEAIDSVVKSIDSSGRTLPTMFAMLASGKTLLQGLAGRSMMPAFRENPVTGELESVQIQARTTTSLLERMWTSYRQDSQEGARLTDRFRGGLTGVRTTISNDVLPSFKSMAKSMLFAGAQGAMIAVVFKGIGWALDNTVNKYKNLDKELQANYESSKSQLDSLKEQRKSLGDIASEYDKLASKSKRSAQEEERYIGLRNQIADMSPDLVVGYDENNDPILKLSGSLEGYVTDLDSAIEKQKMLTANDSMEVGKNAIDGLKSKWNIDTIGTEAFRADDLALGDQGDKIITERYNLVNKLNQINEKTNITSWKSELKNFADANEKYSQSIVDNYQKVKESYDEIEEENVKGKKGMNDKFMINPKISGASDEIKKLGAMLIDSFDLSEIDSKKFDQILNSMTSKISSGEFDSSINKISELRDELEKTHDYTKYEESIKQYIPELAKFLGVSEDVATQLMKVPEGLKAVEDDLDVFLRSLGKTKKMMNFDVEAETLANQFYAVSDALDMLSDAGNFEENVNGKVTFDVGLVTQLKNDKNLPEEIRSLIGIMDKDGNIELPEAKVIMDVMTAYQLGDTQQAQDLLNQVQIKLDEMLGDETVNVKDMFLDVDAKIGKVSINDEELKKAMEGFDLITKKENLSQIELLIKTGVVGLDQVEYFQSIMTYLPTNEDYTTKFIVENMGALDQLNSYQEVVNWLVQNPDIITKYKIDVTGEQKLADAQKKHDELNGKSTKSEHKVETNADEAKGKVEELNKEKDKVGSEAKLKIDAGSIKGSSDALNKLAEASEKIGDGKYKISFDSDITKVVGDLEKLNEQVDIVSAKFDGEKALAITVDTTGTVEGVKELGQAFKILEDNTKGLGTIVFSTDTETASRNVTGLKNNVSDYVDKYAKTFTTTFKVNTQYNTTGTPTTQSSGVGISGVAHAQELSRQIQSDTLSMQSMAMEGVATAGEASAIATSTYGTAKASSAITRVNPKEVLSMLDMNVNMLAEMENSLKRISNELDILEKKAVRAYGKDKIKLLEQQISLMEKQQKMQHELAEGFRTQANEYKNYLSQKGFSFDSDGMVTNYQKKLLAIEKELKSLEKSENSARKSELEKTKKILEAYIDLSLDKIPSASKEWLGLANSIKDTADEIQKLKDEAIFEPLKNALAEVEHALDRVNDKLDLLNELNDKANGAKQIEYLKKKVNLLKEQQNVLGQMNSAIKDQMIATQNKLWKYGFTLDDSSLIANYDEVLNSLVGTEQYEEAKKYADEYIALVRDKLPDAWKEWLNIENTIKDIQDELEKLERQQKLFASNAEIKELGMLYDELGDKLDMISEKLKYANGTNKLDLLKEQIKLLEEQMKLQEGIIDAKKGQLGVYQEDLGKYGFKFDTSGTVENLDEILNKYKDHDDLEKITELVDEYIKLQRDELPDAILEWEKLNNAIKDAHMDQLNTAKEIEDKVTAMYKKQIQDRIDAMNKETEAKIKALKKQQDAYNKYRDEVDYQNEYDEKLNEIGDLQKELDIAMKDSSINGQKKVKELQKLIADAQKELEKLTQDKIDKDINDAFDKEQDRIDEENKNNIEEFEKEWSDSKIAEMVAQALGSGVFTDIEGNVHDLEDALVNFAEETGELFGVLGSVIKAELITNLGIAKDAVKELSNILKDLELEAFKPSSNGRMFASPIGASASVSTNNSISFNAPIITIEGNADGSIVKDLESYGQRLKNEIVESIARAIR